MSSVAPVDPEVQASTMNPLHESPDTMGSWVKVTTQDACHRGFQFREGLNQDINELDGSRECGPGGLYFARRRDVHRWVTTQAHVSTMWDVIIPYGERVIEYLHKAKARRIILRNPRPIPADVWMAAVKYDGMTLEAIQDQTPELCMAAVLQDGYAVSLVKDQTPELCMAAVQQYGDALQYVDDQTSEICMAAVLQNEDSLQYVKKQTPEICMAAVEQGGCALQYVKKQTPEMKK